jgi:hypothetical protein
MINNKISHTFLSHELLKVLGFTHVTLENVTDLDIFHFENVNVVFKNKQLIDGPNDDKKYNLISNLGYYYIEKKENIIEFNKLSERELFSIDLIFEDNRFHSLNNLEALFTVLKNNNVSVEKINNMIEILNKSEI